MAFSKAEAKSFMVGIVLLMVSFIFFVRLLPYLWGYIQGGSAEVGNTSYTLSDVAGGDLITGLGVFLFVLLGTIAIILKLFDIV